MGEFTFKRLSDLEDAYIEQVCQIFVNGFYDELNIISSDKDKLIRIFAPSLIKEHFFVALDNNREVVGITAFATKTQASQIVDKEFMKEEFGNLKGRLLTSILNKKSTHIKKNQCNIEKVATASEYRGKGVATQLINHILSELPYEEFILEAMGANKSAVFVYKNLGFRVYKNLGFRVYKTRKQLIFHEKIGFAKRLYMKKEMKS
ncbi:GNAT family N-acetyltransferase [Virgibacillus sp. NKC19-16]|uniref:GNAT family N-acetyltransferase n=1 Tax=Virgibacillus salidurans TaxID=2831673 RepID=UPI001F34746C|nr:GNAT family N-acetyltransferase [Virgibacillus sp. NKC19-16]UJL46371.1 GNAT family N-acetyltransferase [Virgibacillus sp. NKC19-16]